MAGVVFLGSKVTSLKDDGTVNAAGKIYFYEAGTTTDKDTYSDSALTTANANPVILDSAGRASVWLSGDYSIKITDSSDNTIYTDDNINPAVASVTSNYNLALNGSFEDDTNADGAPDDWDLLTYTGSTNARDTTDQTHGAACMKFTSTGSGGGRLTSTNFFEVEKSSVIEVLFALKSSVVDVRNVVQVLWYKADQTASSTISTDVFNESAANPTSWTNYNYPITIPSDAAYAKIRIFGCHSSDATAGTTRFDNVIVRLLSNAAPSFRVYLSSNQVNITGIDKVELDTEDWDTSNDFDSITNYRYTPSVAGKYYFYSNIALTNTNPGDDIRLYLYKNGGQIARVRMGNELGADSIQITTLVEANGTTDYFEVFLENANRDTSTVLGGTIYTYFIGYRIGD